MFRCDEMTKISFEDEELSWKEKLLYWLHILICPPCKKFRESSYKLKSEIRKSLNKEKDDSTVRLEDSILNKIKSS